MKEIVIRCDGGTHIGMGHVVRCVALADMLRANFKVSLVMQQTDAIAVHRLQQNGQVVRFIPRTDNFMQDAENLLALLHEPSIVVLDGYQFDTQYQQAIKNEHHKLVAIDDLHAWHHVADVVINHADGVSENSYSKEAYTKLLLGLRYVLLRKEFLQLNQSHQQRNNIEKFFISMGASDLENNTIRFARALLKLNNAKEIHVMASHVNKHLPEIKVLVEQNSGLLQLHTDIDAKHLSRLLGEVDMVISPASSISLEACAVGVGLAVGYTANNQQGILKGLMKSGVANNFGNLNALSEEDFITRIESICNHPEILNTQIERQRQLLDGQSGARLVKEFRTLAAQQSLTCRVATKEDVQLHIDWSNDPELQQYNSTQYTITRETHTGWFHRILDSKDDILLIFELNNMPVGHVRFSLSDKNALFHCSITKEFRGQGLSTTIIEMAVQKVKMLKPLIEIVQADVKQGNRAYTKSLEQCGFTVADENAGEIVYRKQIG